MGSKVPGGFSLIPNGGFGPGPPDVTFDAATGIWENSFEAYITTRPQKQYRLDGSKFLDIGTMNHELKFGFGYRNTPVKSFSGWPGQSHGYYVYNNFGPADCAAFGAPADCLDAG